MLVATFLAVFLVPALFVMVERLFGGKKGGPAPAPVSSGHGPPGHGSPGHAPAHPEVAP
jgi:hypothetical protein